MDDFCEMMINLLSLFSSLNFKKRIINPNFNEHEKSIIHESSKKSKSKTKKSVYLSQFRTHFFLSFKLFNKPKNNLLKLFFFQRYYNPKIYRKLAAFLLFRARRWYKKRRDTRAPFSPFSSLGWPTKQENDCVQQVSLSRFPRPVMNILFYLPFTRLRALRPMTCLLTSTIACTNVDRPFLSGPNTDLSIFIRPIMLAFTRHAYHDSDW